MKRVSVYYTLHKILNQQQSLELYKNNLFYCNLIQFIIANWKKQVEKYIFFSQYRPVQLPSVSPNAGWKRKRERDRESMMEENVSKIRVMLVEWFHRKLAGESRDLYLHWSV